MPSSIHGHWPNSLVKWVAKMKVINSSGILFGSGDRIFWLAGRPGLITSGNCGW